ncbi:MAG: glycosyltransferase family 2 protein [Bryobacteraceae bacterium]
MVEGSVCAVIPTWNRSDLVGNILENLKRQTQPVSETIVVDNGSEDDTLEATRALGARAIKLASNQGFAKAVNAGIVASEAEWVLVLNNDVELDPQWLEYSLKAANDERASLVVGKLLRATHAGRIDGAWDLVAASGCAWRCGWNLPDGDIWDQRRNVQIAPLTACLINRRVFDSVGLLDAEFESYYEDVDFGLRFALAGFTGIYEPKACAVHLGSATLGSSKTTYFVSRNQVLLATKFGLGKLSLSRVLVGQALFLLTTIRQRNFVAALRGKWDGARLVRRLPKNSAPPARLQSLLRDHEMQIRDLQSRFGWDFSWRIYFAVLGCG